VGCEEVRDDIGPGSVGARIRGKPLWDRYAKLGRVLSGIYMCKGGAVVVRKQGSIRHKSEVCVGVWRGGGGTLRRVLDDLIV
jgi:hypothetical protein